MDTGLHTTTGMRKLGVTLSMGAVLMWGLLPVALHGMLGRMDPVTITCYRFALAGALLIVPVARSGRLKPLLSRDRRVIGLLAVATVALVANYLLFVLSLRFVPPSAAQVLIQLAPLCLLLGSLLVFRERLVGIQRAGIAALVLGLGLFFHSDLPELARGESGLAPGVVLLVGAAVTWGIYALAQKQLLRSVSSPGIMVVIYIASSLILLPIAKPASIASLDGVGIALLAFLGINTLAAYGCFSEALEHLEASRVSVVLALTPLVTIAVVTLGARVLPAVVEAESIDALSLVGAGLVVAGSMVTALGGSRRTARPLQNPLSGVAR